MAVIRLDKITGGHLESIRHTAVLKNGHFVQLGALISDETELYSVEVATDAADLKKEFLLHATPEVMADPRFAGLKHFQVEAGDQGRAYHLVKGDVITLTADLIDGTPVVDQFVVPQLNSLKLEASPDGLQGSDETSLVFVVVRKTTLGYDGDDAYQLRVIKS
ncbi:hypothetical protein BSK59_15515 [Paenibacillus odorifer]|uniref:hypothetical protein n=1 Tax=Paenibacillus odorifer TaxID=189426 RepID=UPI00096DDA4F|nr:hypothetical protein [Paenibacillus odorifer]OME53987.1 hypothetical protein BSK59_15515 [Paenibacillus odorifer]